MQLSVFQVLTKTQSGDSTGNNNNNNTNNNDDDETYCESEAVLVRATPTSQIP